MATTPVIRSFSVGTELAGASSVAVARPAGLVAGDYLLALHVGDADNTLNATFNTLSSAAGDQPTNIPPTILSGRIATSGDAAASTFTFSSTYSFGDASIILLAIQKDTFDPDNPVTTASWTRTARTSTTTQTAPSMTGVVQGLLLALFATDANGVTQSYPTSGPSGMTRVATQGSTNSYSLAGIYSQELASTSATGTKTVSPTPSSTTNGWSASAVIINPFTGTAGFAPVPVATYQLDNRTSGTTLSIPDTAAGEILVAKVIHNGTTGITVSGGGYTWASRKVATAASHAGVYIFTATATGGGFTLTVAGGLDDWSCVFERWTNAALATTPASNGSTTGGTTLTTTLTPTAADSAITWCASDWSENDFSSGSMVAGNTREYGFLSGTHGGLYGYYGDTGAIGSKSIGATTPTITSGAGQIVGIEILAAGGSDPGGGGGGVPTTLGKTADGASSSASSADKISVSQATASGNGKITTGHARLSLSATGSCSAKMVVFADSGSAPGAKVAESDVITVTATTATWHDFVFSGVNKASVTNGTSYYVGVFWQDPGTPSINVWRDATTNGRAEVAPTWPTVPDPFGTATLLTGPIDAYVDVIDSVTYPLTLSHVGTATTVAGTTTTGAITLPTGTAVDDITYAWVHTKATANTTETVTTPAGWTLVGSYSSTIARGASNPGNGIGPTVLWLYRIQHASTPGTVTFTGTNLNAIQAVVRTYRPSESGGVIAEKIWAGRSIASSTALGGSLTVAAGDLIAEDWVELAWGIADDDGASLTTNAPTCTGATFDTFTAGPSHDVTANGNDEAIAVRYGRVSAGPSSGTSLTITATAGVANTAIEVGFRTRVTKVLLPPSANAGSDATIVVDSLFSRTASEGGGTQVTARTWKIQSGPAGVGTTLSSAAALSWTPSVVGTYVLRYSITNAAATVTDDITVTVQTPAPTVDAGADASSIVNMAFAQTATESGSGITTRSWKILAGPAGVGTTIGSAAALSWTPSVQGTYTLEYKATNGTGSGTDQVDVTITAPIAPVVNAGTDASTVAGSVFSRTATEVANGAAITARSWIITAGPFDVGSSLGTAAALSWTPNAPGTYTLQYSGTNSAGSDTDDVVITVTAAPSTPTMPTLVPGGQYASGIKLNGTSYVTPSFTPSPGEVIIVKHVNGTKDDPTPGTPTGTGLTFAKPTGVSAPAPTGYGDTTVFVATAGPSPSATTITCPTSATTNGHAWFVERWTNASVAATPATNATKSDNVSPFTQPVTTTQLNSVVTGAVVDWNAVNPSGKAYAANNVEISTPAYNSTYLTGYTFYCPAPTIGAYTVGLTAPAGQKDTIAAMEILGIPGAPSAPTASAGSDVSATLNQLFSRTGGETGSGITERQWRIVSGPAGAGTVLATVAALSWTPTVAGTYVLEYAVGNNGGTATSTATITVIDPVPVVGAGTDASVVVNTAFSRTATETNSPTSRAWTIQAGPAGVGNTIGTAAALSWTPSVTGTYTLRYSATNAGGTGIDDVVVTVVYPPPTAGAGTDVVNFVVNTQFTRTATENGNGDTITARLWTIVSGPAGVGSTIGVAAALAWTPATAGAYVLRYSVTTSGGTTTDDMSISVVLPAPVVGAGADVTVVRNVVFARTATETGQSITAREWRVISGPDQVNAVIGAAAALSWTPTALGTYVLRYTATNSTGSGTDDASITAIAVPTVGAGTDAAITNRTPFTRTGTETDNGSAVTAREWRVISGPADVNTILTTTTLVNWTPTVPGTYVLRYSATNAAGAGTDDVTLTVNAVTVYVAGVASATSSATAAIHTAGKIHGSVTADVSVVAGTDIRVVSHSTETVTASATVVGNARLVTHLSKTSTAAATATSSARVATRVSGTSSAVATAQAPVRVVAVVLGSAHSVTAASGNCYGIRPLLDAFAQAVSTASAASMRLVTTLDADPLIVQAIVIRANLELPVPWIARAVSSISGKLRRVTPNAQTITATASVHGTPRLRRIIEFNDVTLVGVASTTSTVLTRVGHLNTYTLRVNTSIVGNSRGVYRYSGSRVTAVASIIDPTVFPVTLVAGTAHAQSSSVGTMISSTVLEKTVAAVTSAALTLRNATYLHETVTATTDSPTHNLRRFRPISGVATAIASAVGNYQRRVHTLHQEVEATASITTPGLRSVFRYLQIRITAISHFGERPPRLVQVTDQGEGSAHVRSYREVIKVRGIAMATSHVIGNLIWAPKRHPARAIATMTGHLRPVRTLHRTITVKSSVRSRFIIVPRMTDIVRYYPAQDEVISPVDTDADLIPDQLDPYPTVYNFFVLR